MLNSQLETSPQVSTRLFSIQVNKIIEGRPDTKSTPGTTILINGDRLNYFPNSHPTHWHEVLEVSPEQYKNLVLRGRCIKWGTVPLNKKQSGGKLYDLVVSTDGCYLDLDDLDSSTMDLVLADPLFDHCFFANYSYSVDFEATTKSAHASFVFSRPAVVAEGEHQKLVKALYFYLSLNYNKAINSIGKLDKNCFDPGRLKYGTKADPRCVIKFDNAAVLDLDYWLKYYQINEADIKAQTKKPSKKSGEVLDFSNDSQFNTHWLDALKVVAPKDLDWSDAESISYYPHHDWAYHETNDKGTQYDGFDCREWLGEGQLQGRSRSSCLTFCYDNKQILYYPRSSDNEGGNFISYILHCYKAKTNNPEIKDSKILSLAIQDYLKTKGDINPNESYKLLLGEVKSRSKNSLQNRKNDIVFQDLKSSNPFTKYWNDDQLVDLSALSLKNLFCTEQVSNDVYKWKILPTCLGEVFLKFYEGRIRLLNTKGRMEFSFYQDTMIDGKVAYCWLDMDQEILLAKMKSWLTFYYCEGGVMSFEDFTLVKTRCHQDFLRAIGEFICTLPKVTAESTYNIDDNYLGFRNGVYSIRHQKLFGYSPQYNTNRIIPFDYEPNKGEAEFQYLRSFFKQWLDVSDEHKDQAVDHFMNMLCVTWAAQASKLKMMLWIVGESNSGKNEKILPLLNVLSPYTWQDDEGKKVYQNNWNFPKELSASDSIETLFGNQFGTIAYKDCYAILFDEQDRMSEADLRKIKSCIGTDNKARAEIKGGARFALQVKALHIFLTEEDPNIPQSNKGGMNRLQLFNCKPIDINAHRAYKEWIDQPENLKALLLYAVSQNIPKIIQDLQGEVPEFMSVRKRLFQADNDPWETFYNDCFESSEGSYVRSRDVLSLYKAYSANSKINEIALGRGFSAVLKRLSINKDTEVSKQIKRGSERFRVFLDIKFSDSSEQYIHGSDFSGSITNYEIDTVAKPTDPLDTQNNADELDI